MAARTPPTGEWCSPTREITGSQLIRLIDESRHREAVVEMIHDVPTRQCPAATLELLERTDCSTMLIDLRSLGEPDALEIEQELDAPDPDPATLRSEPEVEQEPATLTYAPMPERAMPPTAAQSIATGAHRDRERVASVRLLLYLDVLLFLCVGVLACLGLGTWA
jgi:hypothetical protein